MKKKRAFKLSGFPVAKGATCCEARLAECVCLIAVLVVCGLATSCGGADDEKMLRLGEWEVRFPRPLRCRWSVEAGTLRMSKVPAVSVLAMCSNFGLTQSDREGLTGADVTAVHTQEGTLVPEEVVNIACCEMDVYKRKRRFFTFWRTMSGIDVVQCQYGGREVGPEDVRKVIALVSGSSALIIEATFAVTADYSLRIDEVCEIRRHGQPLELR